LAVGSVGYEASWWDAKELRKEGEHRSAVSFTIRESELAEGVVLFVRAGLVDIGRVQIGEVGKVTVTGVVFGEEGDGKGIEGTDIEFRNAREEQIVRGGAGVLFGFGEVVGGVKAEDALVERRLDDANLAGRADECPAEREAIADGGGAGGG
jgi:hypothetical protein